MLQSYETAAILDYSDYCPRLPATFFETLFSKAPYNGEFFKTSDIQTVNRNSLRIDQLADLAKNYAIEEKPLLLIRDVQHLESHFGPELCRHERYFPLEILWAFQTITASVSSFGASVGYHADNYYVGILQVSGTRNWKVWHRDVLSEEEKGMILRENPRDTGRYPSMPDEKPLLDIELKPGEMLWMPPVFPHMGTTSSNENSVSLSFAFSAISHIKLALSIRTLHHLPLSIRLVYSLLKTPHFLIPLHDESIARNLITVELQKVAEELGIVLTEEILNNQVQKIMSSKA